MISQGAQSASSSKLKLWYLKLRLHLHCSFPIIVHAGVWHELHFWGHSFVGSVFQEEANSRFAELTDLTTCLVPTQVTKKETLTTYCTVVTYLVETCPTSHMIKKACAEIKKFRKSPNRTLIEYGKLFQAKVLHSNQVHHKYIISWNFIEDLQNTTDQSIRSFWGSWSHGTGKDLVQQAISLTFRGKS